MTTETEIDTCPTCGVAVRVAGNVTKHFQPVERMSESAIFSFEVMLPMLGRGADELIPALRAAYAEIDAKADLLDSQGEILNTQARIINELLR
jgi:hypothetical protein